MSLPDLPASAYRRAAKALDLAGWSADRLGMKTAARELRVLADFLAAEAAKRGTA